MAPASTKTENAATENSTEIPAFAQKFREQLVSTVQQSQQLSIDAAQHLGQGRVGASRPSPDGPAQGSWRPRPAWCGSRDQVHLRCSR